ncbi:RNA-binding protein [Candidatus Woesearchaeota archaeon]|nr:RNA-binding protein [Candidatus Woesearchaeota archaeon]
MQKRCTSCNVEAQKGSTSFKCPSCQKTAIVRCFSCRQTAAKYKCKECGFAGPN